MSAVSSPSTFEKAILTGIQSNVFKTALAGTMVRLFKNNFVPGAGTVIGDFTEADFTGYAGVAQVAWNPPVLNAVDGRWFIAPPGTSDFTVGGGPVTPNTIYGYYIDDGTDAVAFERFDNPVEMDVTGKNLKLLNAIQAMGIEGPDSLEV